MTTSNAAMSLTVATLEGSLRRITETLAYQFNTPSAVAPLRDDREWRIAKAVLALQGMSALFNNVVNWQGPEHWHAFLREQSLHVLLRQGRIADLLDAIDRAARIRNLPVVPLKGAALGRLGLYRAGGRPMGDIDLLIEPGATAVATEIIESLGFSLTFANTRHAVFAPHDRQRIVGYGEHIDHPLKIELHTKIAEQLPVAETNITAMVFPGSPAPGLNSYPSLAALMSHLLLHAANNIRARALRQIQLHDIALLAARMRESDWSQLLASADQSGPWWAHCPLTLTARYYPSCIPDEVIRATMLGCPKRLRHAARHNTLTDVSWSNIRMQAFPGIEWSRSRREAIAFAKSRIAPQSAETDTLRYTGETQPWGNWYRQLHIVRIARWIFARPPRVQTLYSVREALKDS